jgi:hypothetical protein
MRPTCRERSLLPAAFEAGLVPGGIMATGRKKTTSNKKAGRAQEPVAGAKKAAAKSKGWFAEIEGPPPLFAAVLGQENVDPNEMLAGARLAGSRIG